ncbi:uncharacterized protein N7515_000959 [Penicillium bovifimosum]|uniref:Cytochrome P450 n=1 Tax=Penicillium bovifimosum TaxID=126998 RepID=A0A9W9LBW4_9EURO|nr:uncharacterized protein N7515_000959 [Penicillium bovifimosum]KAJ5146395.1 hypothetical protein N7515_000959 [Penicillium bovifimosum]
MAGTAFWPLVGALIALLYLLRRAPASSLSHIPTVKYYPYMPDFINRILYYSKAGSMIYRGYEKYKDSPFRILTGDGEVIVLPVKYQDQLRSLDSSKISSLHAQYKVILIVLRYVEKPRELTDFSECPGGVHQHQSRYCLAWPDSAQVFDAQSKVVPRIIDELTVAFDTVLAGCEDDWVKINPTEMSSRLIVLATSRVMAGDMLRRNEEWLNVASSYAHNVGVTIVILRPVPKYLRPIVARFLPSVQQMKKQLKFAKALFVPLIEERKLAEEDGGSAWTKPDDFLQWIMDLNKAQGEDLDADALAHHMLLLVTLAVTHTSTMALCHGLFDLAMRPEYLEPLREEMLRTLPDGWYKATQASLLGQVRLDSFLLESQRFGPPGELTFHRIVKQPLTLKDGLVLPVDTHICFPAGPISRDEAFITNPTVFDGFRWCHAPRDRFALTPELINSNENEQDKKSASLASSFVSIALTHMHFGFGRQACPGRFFAVNTLKAILSRIILDYEFKFVDGLEGERPANLVIGEHIIPSMSAEMLFRKRSTGL